MFKNSQNKIHGSWIRILVLALYIILPDASATTYWVAANGGVDNANYGTFEAPFKTIQYAADKMIATGDVCNIRTGTYRETVTVKSSNLTFQAYNGEIVTISGTDTLPNSGESWTLENSNIYYIPMNWNLGDGNQVFQNSVMKPEARWPNNSAIWQGSRPATPPSDTYTDTWSYIDSFGYDSQLHNGWFTDIALPNMNWTNCTVHIVSGYGWVMFNQTITDYDNSAHKLFTDHYYGYSPAYAFTEGNEYYITGSKGLMDTHGEWWYDTPNQRLYFYSSSEPPTGIETKVRPYGFDLSGKSHINLINLRFFACTIKTDTNSVNCVFDGLNMQYLNHSRKHSSAYGITLRDDCVLRNSELAFDSSGLVELAGNDIRVINNYLHDSGYVPSWMEMLAGDGYRNLISHNTLHDSGRPILGFLGKAAICEYNDMYNAMKLTTDGAILHSNKDAGNTIFRYNLLHDSYGPQGHSGESVQGFYLDCLNANWIIHHNIIWNLSGYAMHINNRHNFIMIFNNTCWNTDGGIKSSFDSDGDSGTRIFNNLFNSNPYLINADMRYNFYLDPLFINPSIGNFQLQTASQAIDNGIYIPNITDGYYGNAPDIGAQEFDSVDWTVYCGHDFTTPPSPDPSYNFPSMLFANQLKDGGFETGSFSPNWTTTGSVSLLYENSWLANANTRSGWYATKLSSDGAEVIQTISNLQPNRRYVLYAGIKKMNASDNITIGVKNYGHVELFTSAFVQDTDWHMYSQSFVTGLSSTSAEVYIRAVDIGNAVYVDDTGIIFIAVEDQKKQNPPMSIVHYSFNENSGLTAHDSTIPYVDGVLSGNMTNIDWVSGILGNALDFDGVDDYVQTLPITTPEEITVACWVKSNTELWNAWGCFVSQRPSFTLGPEKDSRTIRFTIYNGATGLMVNLSWTPPEEFDITSWHHYTAVFSPVAQQMLLYADGILRASRTANFPIQADTGAIYIGRDDYWYDNIRNLNGQIDDVRIYDFALTQEMITASISAVNSTDLLHFMFNESTGTGAWDCSGKGNNGALINMTPQPLWIEGKIKGALSFDGVDDYVQTLPVTTPEEITVACWVKSNTELWNAWGCFVSQRPSFTLGPEKDSRTIRFTIYNGATGLLVNLSWAPPEGFDITSWHHYTAVFSPVAQQMLLYADGILRASRTANFPIQTDTGAIYIGRDDYWYDNIRNLNGQIDDVRIYSRSLDWQEILDIVFMFEYPYESF